ncbi:outer spore coat protein CotE [Tuberibacillus calidus]|uniref:outer spore coat protein CotE n=1 Tax=Tuberibacillus calidus TaxID=340097 RepID=UPI0004196687|nr:outer spore coat protein CotE [Tuberibacillus calidus]
MAETDYNYREIITKAVCGKGKKFSQNAHTITPTHKPSSILGCWVINHKFRPHYQKDAVIVEGSYDINVWYSYNNNTKTEVVSETFTYRDEIALTIKDRNVISDRLEVYAHTLQEPSSLETNISPNGNKIIVQVEKEMQVELIGETKVRVNVDADSAIDEDWEDDLDEALDELDSEFLVGEVEE